jgi:hypothetical protein
VAPAISARGPERVTLPSVRTVVQRVVFVLHDVQDRCDLLAVGVALLVRVEGSDSGR